MLHSLWGLLAWSLEQSWHLLLRDPHLALGWRPCLLGRVVLGLLLLLLVPRQAEEEAQDGLQIPIPDFCKAKLRSHWSAINGCFLSDTAVSQPLHPQNTV